MKTQVGYSSRKSVHINSSKLARATRVLSLAVLGLLPLAATAQPACVSPPSGLVGWWRGEGNGNDNAGTNNAFALPNVSFTNGIVGRAFAFEPENLPYGTYSGVQIADQPYYGLTNSLTIEGWIRPRGPSYVIFYRGDNRSGLDPYAMGMGLNNILSFGITDANGDTASVSAPLVYNQWWYVVGTLDGASGKLSLYTNGTLAAQITTTVRPFGNLIPQDSPGIGIGNVNDGFNNFPFIGDIDEISLYNRALSGAEIAAIYNADGAGKCTTAVPPCAPPPSGLVSWWPGEGTASDAVDGASGNLYGAVSFAPGRVGQSFAFNGIGGGVNVPDLPALELKNSLTIECWLFVTNAPSVPGMVLFRGDTRSGFDPYYVSLEPLAGTSGMLGFIVHNQANTSASVTTPMPLGTWTHMAATLDDATGRMTLYTNAVVAAQITTTVRPLGPLNPNYHPGVGMGVIKTG
jgi:hypothetical protein